MKGLKPKIPTTVITGFLGSGKTTMLKSILQNAGDRRIALVINEFGEFGVDKAIIDGCGIENCSENDVIELKNGCICCTVADEFIPTMTNILEWPQRPDHIIIETSGLALPQPLIAAFNWPEIATELTVDGVIAVIDSAAVADGRFADNPEKIRAQGLNDNALEHENSLAELFEDQICAADMIVLNKTDLIDDSKLQQIRTMILEHHQRKPPIVETTFGNIPIEILLGLGANSAANASTRQVYHNVHHDSENHDHDHQAFKSFGVPLGPIADHLTFIKMLKDIISNHDILRLKGFIYVSGKPFRLVLQAVGERINCYFDRPWGENEQRSSQLIVIGLNGLDEQTIINEIRAI